MGLFFAVVLVLSALLTAFVVWQRGLDARLEREAALALEAYVHEQGGQLARMGPRAFRVDGSLGSAVVNLAQLRSRLELLPRDQWPGALAGLLRKTIPDPLLAAGDRVAADALARELREAEARLAALDAEALRSRLRVAFTVARAPHALLAPLARRLSEHFEARVVLDGFPRFGVPVAVRARWPESDAELVSRAHAQTLQGLEPGALPPDASGDAYPLELVLAPAVLGPTPRLLAQVGERLAVRPVDDAPRRLEELTRLVAGQPTRWLLLWDGNELHDFAAVVRSVRAEGQPGRTIAASAAVLARLGLEHPPQFA